jgi:DNA-binding transcriptional MerR regulator
LDKAPDAFRTISEVADEINVPQHVLRFWESRFTQIRPLKRGGGRRYYRPDDVDLLRGVRYLLYDDGYTIRGVQRILREQGLSFVQGVWRAGAEPPPPELEEDKAGGAESQAAEPSRAEPSFFELSLETRANERSAARREPTMAAPAAADSAPRRLRADDAKRRKLQTVLDELIACRRLLDAALADNAVADD